jgi:hypothetical protein
MIDDKEGHIPSPLILLTGSMLRCGLLEWQKNKGIHLKASKSKLKVDKHERSYYFNYKNDGGKRASYCAATGFKRLTTPGVADTYTFLLNTWNTLPESYQQRVYNITLATLTGQIEQADNLMPAVVIGVEEVRGDNAILLDYLASEVALEEQEIGSIDRKIPIDNNCTNNELHFGMPGGSGDYEDESDESDRRDAIPTARQRRRAATELERFDPGTSHFEGDEGEDGVDGDADEKEEASQADNGSTQNVDD